MQIHQLAFGMIPGDAVSNSALAIDAQLKAWGFQTAMYAQHVGPQFQGRVLPDAHFIPFLESRDHLLIFHYSIYSPNIRLFNAFRGRKLLIYHNITPANFFAGWDRQQAALCNMGRRALQTMTQAELAVGDSEFNRQELIEAGFDPAKTAVLPLFLSLPKPAGNGRLEDMSPQQASTWLTVGRVAPNKAVEDVLRIFAVYHHGINPHSQLFVVGSTHLTSYVEALQQLITDLDLQDRAHLVGHVGDSQLQDYYKRATLYVTASQHEGFCVPLLESMVYGVPILARSSSAIPETLGGAGVLFTELGYEAVAEMGHILVSDTAVRHQVVQTQYNRLEELSSDKTQAGLMALLNRLGVVVGG